MTGHITAQAVRAPQNFDRSKIDRARARLDLFKALDARRVQAGLSSAQWARIACISESTLRRAMRGAAPAQGKLAHLRRALDRLDALRADEFGMRLSPSITRAFCDALLVACAQALNVPLALCQAIDAAKGARGAAADDVTRRAHLARALTYYAANQIYGVPQADIAAAFGIDRAAVCRAMPRIEDQRDDPAFEAIVQRVARMMNQQGAL